MFRHIVHEICKVHFSTSPRLNGNKPLGFIGCGNMGSVLIKHLIEKGNKVICYDRKPKPRETAAKLGATVVHSSGEVAKLVDIMFLLLPDSKSIMYSVEEENGIISAGKKDLIVVDMSTIGPVNVVRTDMALTEHGIKFLSAPASGGAKFHIHDSLIFTVGGKKSILDKVEPYLNQMAHKHKKKVVFHIGEHIADGQAARICNLLLAACCMVGTAEVMNLGMKLGINPKILSEAMCSSSAQCWACQYYNPVPNVVDNAPSTNDYKPGETVYTFLKALGISHEAAAKMFSPIPACSMAMQMYAIALARGYAEKDFSVVYQVYKQSLVKLA